MGLLGKGSSDSKRKGHISESAIITRFLQCGYVVLSPFALAVLWWWWADASGYTKRVEIEKMEARKQARIEKQRAASCS